MQKTPWTALFLAALTLSFFSNTLQAGGAFSTTPAGEPVLWADTITYRLDPGGGEEFDATGGGCALEPVSKQQALLKDIDAGALVRQAFNTWAAVEHTDLASRIVEGPVLPTDVNLANMGDYLVGAGGAYDASACYEGGSTDPECLNSVVFDPSGLITESILGNCSQYSVLGFASILPLVDNDYPQNTILDNELQAAQMVISGACLDPVIASDPGCAGSAFGGACPAGGISSGELAAVITHEVGHFLGFDHTLVNKQAYIDCGGIAGGDADNCNLQEVPTMIGFFVEGLDTTLHYDDEITARRYYPSADQAANTCSIMGEVFRGADPWRGEEVVARLDNDPLTSAGFVSGAEAPRHTQGTNQGGVSDKTQDNCTANCGGYVFRGLEPGTYTLGTHDFGTTSPFGFVIEPLAPALGGTGDGALDNDPSDDVAPFLCEAGETVTNLDLFTN